MISNKAIRSLLVLLSVLSSFVGNTQTKEDVVYNKIGVISTPESSPVQLELYARFQHRVYTTKNEKDKYDADISSPKSINYLPAQNKFYVHSLEGFKTVVYDLGTLEKLKVINHSFNAENQNLFKNGEYIPFDYSYKFRKSSFNYFKGKPVESCLSHNGKYLWVTYYRRSYDKNSQSPSAVAIIDTEKDEIVRVMPTGILPKMIAASPDNKFVAVTHWGDNTLGIIDISSDNPMDFKYTNHLIVDKRLYFNYKQGEYVNRDKNCGYCLRGTVFTPDFKYLLVGRMGGGGIAVFDVENNFDYLGVTFTKHHNLRHLVINEDYLYMSTNVNGYIDKVNWKELVENRVENQGKKTNIETKGCYVGIGARTIVLSTDGKYIFASVNNESKIVVIDASTMKKVATIPADSFPVGLEITDDNKYLLATAQGRSKAGGGHTVTIFEITYNNE
jgi:DNA-binding beta-propeller fold protein YncE